MNDAEGIHRFQFAFTITYHYLFPMITMGLAPLIVYFKTMAIWRKVEKYNQAARFWGKVFGIAFLFGEKRLGQKLHWLAAVLVFAGTWLSGYFIVATDAWMQRPVGYEVAADGSVQLQSFSALLFNEWAIYQYLHNMTGAFIVGAFLIAALGAFYVLSKRQIEYGKIFVKTGIVAALPACVLMLVTGDLQGRMVARHQPATLAAMEGLFKTEQGAPIVLIGQPNVPEQKIDNAITVPSVLSFLTYQRWDAEIQGLDVFPKENHPDNIPLLYFAYHIMVGSGTIFILVMLLAAVQLRRGKLFESNWLLWILMLSFPLPFVANPAGWMTAEIGRQPWLIYNLMRTSEGFSATVSAGKVWFTTLGFMGLYTVLAILFMFLIWRQIEMDAKFLDGNENEILDEEIITTNDELKAAVV